MALLAANRSVVVGQKVARVDDSGGHDQKAGRQRRRTLQTAGVQNNNNNNNIYQPLITTGHGTPLRAHTGTPKYQQTSFPPEGWCPQLQCDIIEQNGVSVAATFVLGRFKPD